jgi:ferric-dicitrate binding protein FerR (iron transport regulator)
MNDFGYYKKLSFDELISDPEFRRGVYFSTPASDQYWREFGKTYPSQLQTIEEARIFLLATKGAFELPLPSEMELQQKLDSIERHVKHNHSDGRLVDFQASRRQALIRWAVAVSILLLSGVIGWLSWPKNQQILVYQTGFGEWENVDLPDGSHVHLNANSTLTLGDDWSETSERRVWLDGEAFFEVQKRPESGSRFQVITGSMVIEVLGTKFNVQKRGSRTNVFLEEGKIKLDLEDTSEYMDPGQFIAYSHEEKAIVSRDVVPQDPYTSWKDGTLERHSKVGLFLQEIKEIYGVEFEIQDKSVLAETRMFRVPLQELEMVIPILEVSLGRKIIKDGNTLIIR